MLWYNPYHQPRPRRPMRHPVVPDILRRLRLLCPERRVHLLPVEMTYLADGTSHTGSPVGIYACTCHPACRHREGWTLDRYTGRPRRLWSAWHDGR